MTTPITGSEEILRAVQNYFDGLYASDAELLRKTFHPTAMITGYGSDGNLNTMTRERFLNFVATVPSPKDSGEAYDMETLSVDQSGTVAAVKVRDAYLGRMFVDYLHLVDTPEGWQIISKAFHSTAQ